MVHRHGGFFRRDDSCDVEDGRLAFVQIGKSLVPVSASLRSATACWRCAPHGGDLALDQTALERRPRRRPPLRSHGTATRPRRTGCR